jgi:hypothetical protein
MSTRHIQSPHPKFPWFEADTDVLPSSRTVPVVVIEHPGVPGTPLRINASDYDDQTHTLWVA